MRHCHAMPFGARVEAGGVRFRLWAPDAGDVTLVVEGVGVGEYPMPAGFRGWRDIVVAGAQAGSRYRFRVGDLLVPDPASRHQPEGVHGPSEVIDPAAYEWADESWRGRAWEEVVIYELHVGTFTPEGSFRAVIDRLPHLVELGITAIELMPLSQFPGRYGWGYDGVLPFAPHQGYGRPEDLKALVDAAHRLGLMVLLDVVYNHFGPEGNYLHATAKRFFTRRHHTPWGQAVNFDGKGAKAVREFFIHNALYWLEEYRFDGLRLDAVHAIIDDSRPHILAELATRVRLAVTGRPIHLVLENDANAAGLLGRDGHGRPLLYTAQWNDDLHHAVHTLLTDESGGYYRDYAEDPILHLGRCLTEGFAYQGQASAHRKGAARGEPSGHLPPAAFVSFLQNHDQIGNRALGERLEKLAPLDAVHAALALVLLAPMPPMVFMGEEWAAQTPFLYFCDFGPDLAKAVREGRQHEFEGFPQFHGPNAVAIPDPNDPATFEASKLRWDEALRAPGSRCLRQVRTLLAVRRRELVGRLTGMTGGGATCEVLGKRALHCRWRLGDGSILAVVANLSAARLPGTVPQGGRLLYSTGGDEEALPAWGVNWFLDEGDLA